MPDSQRIGRGSYRRFLRSWLDDPFAVGAVAPSGRPLARLMTREVGPGDRILELGPGTGTVTREILARGVAEDEIYLLERCRGFADLLERNFPRATVVHGDAATRQRDLEACTGTFDCVISGLPLVLFNREQKQSLMREAFRLLQPDGAFYQFTYGGRCPLDRRQLERAGLQARCIGFIALNMPPAFVYRIDREASRT
ncbi:MAG TPA: methyltransferase domain-containing protein [Gammaproteobacteria bacterium]